MARQAGPTGSELLNYVQQLADEAYSRGEIAQRLGIKCTMTLNNRLVRASQQTGKPIPAFKAGGRKGRKKRVESVQIKPRGKRHSFGVNIPQEPLERLGVKPGDRLTLTVRGRRIVVSPAPSQDGGQAGPKPPHLIRRPG